MSQPSLKGVSRIGHGRVLVKSRRGPEFSIKSFVGPGRSGKVRLGLGQVLGKSNWVLVKSRASVGLVPGRVPTGPC